MPPLLARFSRGAPLLPSGDSPGGERIGNRDWPIQPEAVSDADYAIGP
jgi:hypothetical protein